MAMTKINDGRHDFDFLVGEWRIHNRKLADVTDPACDRWVEFEASSWMRQTLGGLGNVDTFSVGAMPDGRAYEGMTMRLFDVEAGVWKIWWASDRAPGQLDPPVEGRWEGKHGVFFGDDVLDGKPIKVRFDWDSFDADTAQWEQAFSFDGGETWVHNWRMSHTRIGG
ncbi:MAG TPA: hypothetical protein VGX23_30840 [Actinocrinis sp.]|nr:hypothetical protein [Actinocrinis sp.]